MPQELNVAELRRIAGLHKGLTPESCLMDWAAGRIERLEAASAAWVEYLDTEPTGDETLEDEEKLMQAMRDALRSNAEVTGLGRNRSNDER